MFVPAALLVLQQAIVFTDVNVVPMDRDRVLTGYTVVVQGDRIVDMGPAPRVAVPRGAVRIDGQGRCGLDLPNAHRAHADTLLARAVLHFVAAQH